jgi:PAS domain S-box-containing protein
MPTKPTNEELKKEVEKAEEEVLMHKQAEEVGKNEHKYKILFNNLPYKIFQKDKGSVYVSCNDNFARDLDIKPDEINGKTDYDFFPKELAKKYRADDRRIISSGKTEEIEEKYLEDGQEIWVLTVKTPIRDAEDRITGVIGVFRDITWRKRAEAALRESEEKHSTLVENSLTGIYIDQDGKIVFANKRFAEIYGYSTDEVAHLKSWQLVHPEDSALTNEIRQKRLNGEKAPSEYEARGLTKNGRTIWVARRNTRIEYNGRPAILGNILDITWRKRAEGALRESEAEKQAILDASIDRIRLVDKNLRILWVNKTSATNLDMDPDDIVGETCHKIFADRETPCVDCPCMKAIGTGQIEHAVMHQLKAAGVQGESYWDCHGVPLKDDSGEIVHLIQIARDVTQQKAAEKELERRHHELEAINSILLKVTKEYNLNGMGRVIEDTMQEFYSDGETLVFLLAPNRDSFYFPRPQQGQIKETCYDRARRRIRDEEMEERLLSFLTTEDIRKTYSGGKKADSPKIVQTLAAGFRAWMTTPIEVDGVCHGLVVVGSPSTDIQVEDDLIFVESLMGQISGVIRYQIAKEVREETFRRQLTGPDKFMGIVGRSERMRQIYQRIQSIADSESTVLITGESGTGKELVARVIHQAGKHKNTPFIAAHCSSFVPTLIHSELFGHEKGAFTGATGRKLGRLERAHGGILFLDEVADLPLETQALLLRFLQDKTFERVGGEHPVQVNVRILAATNKHVENEMRANRLREDFYYRLNVIPMRVPPLRERITDVPLLANHFLRTYCLLEEKEITGFDAEAMRLMMDYDWPGNVRELQNTVARCVVLASTESICAEELPQRIRTPRTAPVGCSLSQNERNLIVRVMRECNGNKHEAARLLDISRGTLYSKLKKYNIQP